MSESRADEELMLAWQAGNPQAFEQLYQRYRLPLFSYLLRHLGQRSQAEEVYQDIWLSLIRQRASYTASAAFRSYLFCLAHSRLHDCYRRLGKRWTHETLEDHEDMTACPLAEPEEQLSQQQQVERLRFCLQQLPAEQRSVVLMRLESELSLQTIAEQLNIAFETLKSRFRYAQKKLQQCLRLDL